jgi:hypothetical protein
MPDLLYIHPAAEQRTAREWRTFTRWARRRGYGRIIALPDNGRGDLLFPAPDTVISPGVVITTAPSPEETTV